MEYRCAWMADNKDDRDFLLAVPVRPLPLPGRFDLKRLMPKRVWDQHRQQTCVAHAVAAAFTASSTSRLEISRYFLHYNALLQNGSLNVNSGCSIRGLLKAAKEYGCASAATCQLDMFNKLSSPSPVAYADGRQRREFSYFRVDNSEYLVKSALYESKPLVCALTVYSDTRRPGLEANSEAVVLYPRPGQPATGAHAVLLCGYDDNHDGVTSRGAYLFRNSRGPTWGDGGYGWLPYRYAHDENLSSVFWCVEPSW